MEEGAGPAEQLIEPREKGAGGLVGQGRNERQEPDHGFEHRIARQGVRDAGGAPARESGTEPEPPQKSGHDRGHPVDRIP